MTEKFRTRSRIVSGGFGPHNRGPFTLRTVGVVFENLRQNFQQWGTKPNHSTLYLSLALVERYLQTRNVVLEN